MRLLYLNQYLKIDSDTIISFIYAISFNFIELDYDIKLFKSEYSKGGGMYLIFPVIISQSHSQNDSVFAMFIL